MTLAIEDLENLVAYYDGNGNQTTGQRVRCYEWTSLGTFDIGKWRNSYGRETGALPVGSNTKLYDRSELWEEYEPIHNRECEFSAESAYDSAMNAMVVVGRHVDDVENERKRIKDFYQANLLKCQFHFKRIWHKYEGKFCE